MRNFLHNQTVLFIAVLLGLTGCGTTAIHAAAVLPAETKTSVTIADTMTPTSLPTATNVSTTTASTPTMDPMAGMAGMPGMVGETEVTAEVTSAPQPGNAFLGKLLFDKGIGNPNMPVCSSCHLVDSTDIKVGPSLQNIAIHAIAHANEHHVDLWTFLRTSIVDPNDDIMEAVPPVVFAVNGVSLMYQTYSKDLTEIQIDDIVAYLMTLK